MMVSTLENLNFIKGRGQYLLYVDIVNLFRFSKLSNRYLLIHPYTDARVI